MKLSVWGGSGVPQPSEQVGRRELLIVLFLHHAKLFMSEVGQCSKSKACNSLTSMSAATFDL